MTRISLNSWWQKELCTVEKSKGKANGAHKTRSEWVFAPRCQTSSPPGCPFKKKNSRERASEKDNEYCRHTKEHFSNSPFGSCVCINEEKTPKKKQWSDFFNCEITFNFLLYFYVLQMNECTNLNREIQTLREKRKNNCFHSSGAFHRVSFLCRNLCS